MIFISHATADDTFVNKLAEELQIRGIRAWVDHIDMPAGTRWVKQLEVALHESTVLLLILSKSSVQSSHVESEWHSFFDMKRPIIPLRIDDCELPLFLRTFHQIDFSDKGKFSEQMEALLKVLPQVMEDTTASEVAKDDKELKEEIKQAPDDRIQNLLKLTHTIMNESLLTLQMDSVQFVLPLEGAILSRRLSKPLILGRNHQALETAPDVDLHNYKNSFMISRKHATIYAEDSQIYIKDLSSTNGTFLGEEQLTPDKAYPLKNYSVIFLGREFPIVCVFL